MVIFYQKTDNINTFHVLSDPFASQMSRISCLNAVQNKNFPEKGSNFNL
jgi:hypothetical protein